VDIDDEPLAGHPALRERRMGPEEATMQRERATDVQALLSELAPKDRAAIVMLYWYDLSYQEIAEATGATVSAVKSRLHRARAAMAEAMGHGDSGKQKHAAAAARPATTNPVPVMAAAWM
jgi:RNA polymerase sigma-70 factor (ECF subfamily)